MKWESIARPRDPRSATCAIWDLGAVQVHQTVWVAPQARFHKITRPAPALNAELELGNLLIGRHGATHVLTAGVLPRMVAHLRIFVLCVLLEDIFPNLDAQSVPNAPQANGTTKMEPVLACSAL